MADSALARAIRWDTVVGALLIVVLLLSFSTVDGFGNALNLSFLIGNTLPIALIALPDDPSRGVGRDRSVGRLHSRSVRRGDGRPVERGHDDRDDHPGLSAPGCGLRTDQRTAGDPARTAVPRRHHRHDGRLPGHRADRARLRRGHRLPHPVPGLRVRTHRRHVHPVRAPALPRAARDRRGRAARHPVRAVPVRGRRQRGGRQVRRCPRQTAEVDPVHRDRADGLAHRHLLGAALRQRPLRQRHRTRTLRRRGRPARRYRLRRWQGHAGRRDRRGSSCSARCRT
ncbi:hypothetical protein SALBM311S_05917 [Streptomyces alboniger]